VAAPIDSGELEDLLCQINRVWLLCDDLVMRPF